MIRIKFICLGNICRSPMAEFVFKDKINKLGIADRFFVTSGGTEGYKLGGPMHKSTRELLDLKGIDRQGFENSVLVADDWEDNDYLIVMDNANLRDCQEIFQAKDESKLFKLTDLIPEVNYKEVPDPWYTGDFDETYFLINAGCDALLRKLGFATEE